MIYITTIHEQNIKKRNDQDGAAGHFALAWLVGPVLAQQYGLRYIYNPVIPEYMGTNWNNFLGFDKIVPSKLNSRGVTHYSIDNIANYKIIELPKFSFPANTDNFKSIIHKYKYSSITEDENIILRTSPGQSLGMSWLYWLNNDLREKYDAARLENPVSLDCDSNIINVVCHIRKGDINPVDQPERWITDKQYRHLLENICLTMDRRYIQNKVRIHICSEGDIKDFHELGKDAMFGGILSFHLNESPYITFHRMVMADVLVNAKSAFSVLAAYLNKGIKLVIPFSIYLDHSFPKNDNFKDLISVDNNMDFSKEKLINTLSETKI